LARILVLDAHSFAALAFVRSLGRSGHWVAVGAAEGLPAYADLSRYCRKTWTYPPPTIGASRFVGALGLFVREERIDLVVPVTDATIWPVVSDRGLLPDTVGVASSPRLSLERVNDKYETVELARRLGIAVPETKLIQQLSDLRGAADWTFPIVVKDRYSIRWVDGQGVAGKVSYAYCWNDLTDAVSSRLDLAGDVLIQRFVAGEGIGFSGFMRDEKLFLPFQWRRLREKDPRGSGSSARQSMPIDAGVQQAAERLLTGAAYQGIAMVEFKRSAGDDHFVLMEINGRPWGSIQLPICCGIDYPLHLGAWHLDGRLPPETVAYKAGITCRNLTADLNHLENVWAGRPAGWPLPYPGFLPTLVKVCLPWYPGLRYEDLVISDPRPGLTQLCDWLRIHFRRFRR